MSWLLFIVLLFVPLLPLIISIMLNARSLFRHLSGSLSLLLIAGFGFVSYQLAGIGDATHGGGLGQWYLLPLFQIIILATLWFIYATEREIT